MSRVCYSKLIIPGTVGGFAGGLLIPYVYSVQGGEPGDFFMVGVVIGVAIAVAYANERVRLPLVGAACGSIAALTVFQVPVCDGSHIALPMIGATIGFILFVGGKGFRESPNTSDLKDDLEP